MEFDEDWRVATLINAVLVHVYLLELLLFAR